MNGLREIITQDRIAAEKAVVRRINAGNPGAVGVEKYATKHNVNRMDVIVQGDGANGSDISVLPASPLGLQLANKVFPKGTRRYGMHFIVSGEEGYEQVQELLEQIAEYHAGALLHDAA